MKKVIFLNSGHSLTDPGAVSQYGKESDFNRKIRNELLSELQRNNFQIKKVPDDLDLRGSIAWVNARTKNINDGLAFSIHCNCCGARGAESYYYGSSQLSKAIAKKLIDAYCEETGFINRGARSDTVARWGQLGWIRKTNCWATLIECGFMDSKEDTDMIKDFSKTAKGICKGICKIYGQEYIKEIPAPPTFDKEEFKKKIIDFVRGL